MKYIFTLVSVILILSINPCKAQLADSSQYQFHLNQAQKSKKSANRLLIIGGTGIFVGTSAIAIHSIRSNPNDNAMKETMSIISTAAISILGIGGGSIVSLVSVPYYLTARKHKKLALQLQPIASPITISGTTVNTIGLRATF